MYIIDDLDLVKSECSVNEDCGRIASTYKYKYDKTEACLFSLYKLQ